MIVENRTGGDGLIGIKSVRARRPDGATILVTTGPTMYLLPMVETQPSFDRAKDFMPVSLLGRFEFAIVTGPAINVKDFKRLVAWLRANSSKATFGVPSNGTIPHFMGSRLEEMLRHADDARALSRQRADHQRPDRRPPAVRHHHGRRRHHASIAPTRSGSSRSAARRDRRSCRTWRR